MKEFKQGGYYKHHTSQTLYLYIHRVVSVEDGIYTMEILYIRSSTLKIQAVGMDIITDRVHLLTDEFTNITRYIKLRMLWMRITKRFCHGMM